jgi:hypothetical protein
MITVTGAERSLAIAGRAGRNMFNDKVETAVSRIRVEM